MCGKSRQKLAVDLSIVRHAQRLAGMPFFVHRDEHRKLLVCVASDKLFHIAAAPPCAWGFARSLRETPLQRFHSIIIGRLETACELRDGVTLFVAFLKLSQSLTGSAEVTASQ